MQSTAESTWGAALRGGWSRFFIAMRPLPRDRTPDKVDGWIADAAVDPVALTVMAVNRLGPATLRAVSLGLPVTVAAPDPETAEIFREALSRMAKARPTDRLISVELKPDAEPASRSRS